MAKRRKAARKAVKRKTHKRKAGGKKRKAGGGLTSLTYAVSPELQEVVHSKRLNRPQVVKQMWVYIKRHKLQDSKNRRMINPDKKLGAVIGHKPVDMLKLAGHISKHLKK